MEDYVKADLLHYLKLSSPNVEVRFIVNAVMSFGADLSSGNNVFTAFGKTLTTLHNVASVDSFDRLMEFFPSLGEIIAVHHAMNCHGTLNQTSSRIDRSVQTDMSGFDDLPNDNPGLEEAVANAQTVASDENDDGMSSDASPELERYQMSSRFQGRRATIGTTSEHVGSTLMEGTFHSVFKNRGRMQQRLEILQQSAQTLLDQSDESDEERDVEIN